MEIPVQKKVTHYLASAAVFLIGVLIGGILVSYVFFKVKDRICLLNQPPPVSTELTSNQVQQAASLEQNRTIFGEVISKDAGSFTLKFFVANPLDSKNSTTTTAKIPFDPQKDEVVKLQQAPTSSSVKEVQASFSDIKVGAQVLLKILDGKKTVYLTPSS